jgi:hypothetical protein
MAGVVARLTRGRILGLYVLVATAVPAAFWPVRDVPGNWSCGDSEPPGQDAKIDAFQAGAIPIHAVAALVLLAALCAWSAHRGGGSIAWPTALGAALFGGYLALMLAWNDAYAPLGFVAFVSLAFYAAPILLLVLLVLSLRRSRVRDTAVAALGWALLLVGLPLHLDLVVLQGGGPFFC